MEELPGDIPQEKEERYPKGICDGCGKETRSEKLSWRLARNMRSKNIEPFKYCDRCVVRRRKHPEEEIRFRVTKAKWENLEPKLGRKVGQGPKLKFDLFGKGDK